MKIDLILTFDIGTTSVKVSLFTSELVHLCSFAEEYALDTRPGGLVEVQPERYKDAIRSGLAKALSGSEHRGTVSAIAVTTQGETLIPVDEKGNPLMPAIVWLDARAQKQAQIISAKIDTDEFYQTTGLPGINGALPLCKLAYIKEEMPEIYPKTSKFLMVEDYILYWLTGKFVTEKALQCSTGYFDITADQYWEKALTTAGIDMCKLPEALPCGIPVGKILPETAQELKLPSSATIVTGAMDQVAAALGAGCTKEGIVAESTGTALVMTAYTRHPDFTHPYRVTIYRHALPGSYIYLPFANTAGILLKWFKDNFCPDISLIGQDAYAVMDDLAKNIPAGCDGLITLPCLADCMPSDDSPAAGGVFFGADLSTTRAHFIRSIMESVCFMLKNFITMLSELDIKADMIHSLGGGSRSELWEQMKADICGVPFTSMRCSEAASAGAALLAAWGSGLLPTGFYPEAQYEKTYLPDPNLVKVYQAAYNKFKKLETVIKPLF